MTQQTRIQIVHLLEDFNNLHKGPNAGWLFVFYRGLELIIAAWLLAGATVIIATANESHSYFFFCVGTFLILGALLIVGNTWRITANRFIFKRIRPLLEGVLQTTEVQ